MKKTPNADSKNEVIDGMAPGLKLCVNKSECYIKQIQSSLNGAYLCYFT